MITKETEIEYEEDRVLYVQRWMEAQKSPGRKDQEKEKARWASLAPHLETCVESQANYGKNNTPGNRVLENQ